MADLEKTNGISEGYSSYEDYLKNMHNNDGDNNSDVNQSVEAGDDNVNITPDSFVTYHQPSYNSYSDDVVGNSDPDMVNEDLSQAENDATSSEDSATVMPNHILTQDGGEFGASGFSDVKENPVSRAGGIVNTLKNGIGDSISGVFSGLKSGIKGLFSKGNAKMHSIADSLHVPVQAVAAAAGIVGGGGIVTIVSLLSGGNSIAKYSDIANCNRNEMIDEYVADHGAGDDWTEESAKGAASQIYSALSSPEPWSFDSLEWDGSQWLPCKVINDGFGFSDEAIAGMLANAWAESRIRSDCFEMDYLVHDISTKNDDGEYKYILGENTDFELGRYHHSNWDNYVKRMFEIYAGGGIDGGDFEENAGHGISINEEAYKWRSDYDGPGAVLGRNRFNIDTNRDISHALSVQEGLYPGIGLWQWTGQRAWNMAEFADVQPEPEDKNQDGRNDVLETVDLQLGFLYYENWGNFGDPDVGAGFSQYSVKDEDTYTEYEFTGKEAADIMKGIAEGLPQYSGFEVLEQEGDYKNAPSECYLKANVKFKKDDKGRIGVLQWGRQSKFNYEGKITSDGDVDESGLAYRNISYSAQQEDPKGINYNDSGHDDGTNGDIEGYKGTVQDIDIYRSLYSGQKKSDLVREEDLYIPGEDETTIRWPKIYLDVYDGGYEVGDNNGDERSPIDYGLFDQRCFDWNEGSLKRYIVEHGQGSDNRVCEVQECDYYEAKVLKHPEWTDDADASEYIKYYTLEDEGTDDIGYWAIVAEDARIDYENVDYRSKWQSKQRSDGHDTRFETEDRIARKFDEDELSMFRDMYKAYFTYTTEVVSTDPYIEKYYRWTVLDLKDGGSVTDDGLKDLMEITGEEHPIEAFRKSMRDPKGKYIVADLTLAAGADAATECALDFYNKWEGMEGKGSVAMLKKHLEKASQYYILIKTAGWKSSAAYAHSILEMVDNNKTNHELRDMRLKYVEMGCDEEVHAPDTIAECAVAWAWPKECPGMNDPGAGPTEYYDHNYALKPDGSYGCSRSTSLYVAVHNVVIPEDPYYSSCDRAVCTAVRAAGADEQFPPGNASGCFNYCMTNPDKWENLGPIRSQASLSELEPGDLIIAGVPGGGSGGHVVVFVGEDLPKEKWPGGCGAVNGGKYCCVHASHSSGLDSRGPRCDNDCQWIMSDNRVFYGFRCRQYEKSSEFKSSAEPFFDAGIFNGDGNGGTKVMPEAGGYS